MQPSACGSVFLAAGFEVAGASADGFFFMSAAILAALSDEGGGDKAVVSTGLIANSSVYGLHDRAVIHHQCSVCHLSLDEGACREIGSCRLANIAVQKAEKAIAFKQVMQNADNLFVYPIILPTDKLANNALFFGLSLVHKEPV